MLIFKEMIQICYWLENYTYIHKATWESHQETAIRK